VICLSLGRSLLDGLSLGYPHVRIQSGYLEGGQVAEMAVSIDETACSRVPDCGLPLFHAVE
jgi:hypothetical protein